MQSKSKFVIGDIVKLKSGGNRMTVREIQPALIICEWYDIHQYHQYQFVPETLEKWEPPAPL